MIMKQIKNLLIVCLMAISSSVLFGSPGADRPSKPKIECKPLITVTADVALSPVTISQEYYITDLGSAYAVYVYNQALPAPKALAVAPLFSKEAGEPVFDILPPVRWCSKVDYGLSRHYTTTHLTNKNYTYLSQIKQCSCRTVATV